MMFQVLRSTMAVVIIYALLASKLTHALSIPKSLEQDYTVRKPGYINTLFDRDASTCGGDPSLSQCGGSFPSDFCCAAHTTCLQLNTSSNVVATLCCPAGQDCSNIAPVSCDTGLQNATSNPSSQLHASPPTQLQTCGKACCPMGYTCSGGSCTASPAIQSTGSSSSSVSGSTSTAAPASATSDSSPTSSSAGTSTSDSSPSAIGSDVSPSPSYASSNDGFSGKSFAAGFVPGIAIGALAGFAGFFIVSRRMRNRSNSYLDEKHDPTRDTLTDLGPDLEYRPTMHGRSISEPVANPNLGYRTDFLQSTSPESTAHGDQSGAMGYRVEVSAPASRPANPTPQTQEHVQKVKGLFSRSPFLNQAQTPIPTQAPLPDYLKRGTLSYQITPVRGLKKQRSMHSLRRQVTNATARSASSRRQSMSRNGSTETIQVLMQTPDHEALHANSRPRRDSSASWESIDSGEISRMDVKPSARYAPNTAPTLHQTMNSTVQHNATPTRPGRNGTGNVGASLGTPYSPSNFKRQDIRDDGRRQQNGLTVDREHMKRDTTFSAMMERAGFQKEDFLMSGGAGPGGPAQRR